jgi:hypothetical protein
LTSSKNNLPLFLESDVPESIDVLHYESMARDAGYLTIAGVDEAGRGLWPNRRGSSRYLARWVEDRRVKDSKKYRSKRKAFSVQETAIAVSICRIPRLHRPVQYSESVPEAMRLAVVNLIRNLNSCWWTESAHSRDDPHKCVIKETA